MSVAKSRAKKCIFAIVATCSALDNLAVGPVGLRRVLSDAVGKWLSFQSSFREFIHQHRIDTGSSEATIPHKVGCRLFITNEGGDEL